MSNGGMVMMYKRRIIEMVESIENDKVLIFLYDLIKTFKEKWGC